MSDISRLQIKYKCSYATVYKAEKIVEHITQTSDKLLKILEKQDREELERYFIECFSEQSIITQQKGGIE